MKISNKQTLIDLGTGATSLVGLHIASLSRTETEYKCQFIFVELPELTKDTLNENGEVTEKGTLTIKSEVYREQNRPFIVTDINGKTYKVVDGQNNIILNVPRSEVQDFTESLTMDADCGLDCALFAKFFEQKPTYLGLTVNDYE